MSASDQWQEEKALWGEAIDQGIAMQPHIPTEQFGPAMANSIARHALMKETCEMLHELEEEADLGHPPVEPVEPEPTDPSTPPPLEPDPTTPDPAWEHSIFRNGGAYGWLNNIDKNAAGASVYNKNDVPHLGGRKIRSPDENHPMYDPGVKIDVYGGGTGLNDVTGEMDSLTTICNGAKGPTWWARDYNTIGTTEDLTVYRVGDFIGGREGHGAYEAPAGTRIWRNSNFIQGGAQGWQDAWRPYETIMPVGIWPTRNHVLSWVDCSAIDCGAINYGNAVRAAQPWSIYGCAQSVSLIAPVVRCELKPFAVSGKFNRQSHGFLFVGSILKKQPNYYPGAARVHNYADTQIHELDFQTYVKNGGVTVTDCDVELWNPDRELIHVRRSNGLWLVRPHLVDLASTKPAEIVVANDCDHLEIEDPHDPIRVHVMSALKPHGAPLKSFTVNAHQDFVLDPRTIN